MLTTSPGKSTLLKCFKDKKHRVSCTENMSTDGINIERDLSLSKDSNMLFHAWDLGMSEGGVREPLRFAP